MAQVFADRVQETTITTGTGPFLLGGALNASFQTFAAAPMVDGDTCYAAIVHNTDGSWIVANFTYHTPANTLTAGAILDSSNNGAAVTFATGTKTVFLTVPAAFVQSLLATAQLPTVLTAAGNSQGTATPLVSGINLVLVTAANTGVILPQTAKSGIIPVWNRGNNPLLIYPFSTHKIEAFAINGPVTLSAGSAANFAQQPQSPTQWYVA